METLQGGGGEGLKTDEEDKLNDESICLPPSFSIGTINRQVFSSLIGCFALRSSSSLLPFTPSPRSP